MCVKEDSIALLSMIVNSDDLKDSISGYSTWSMRASEGGLSSNSWIKASMVFVSPEIMISTPLDVFQTFPVNLSFFDPVYQCDQITQCQKSTRCKNKN